MIHENDFVTIIMPVYNGEKYLNETINSVLNQTFSDFEFLIIDDGSSDKTEEIIKSYTDSRICFVKNNENLKIISTLNKGLSLAKGKYIARIDADDICINTRLEKQVAFLESNPSIGLLGSNYKTFGTSNKNIHYPSLHEDLKFSALFYNPFCHPSIMMRKEVLEKYQLRFNPDFLHVEDYKLWTEFLSITHCANLSEELIAYRTHENQISKVHSELQKKSCFNVQIAYLKNAGFEMSRDEIQSLVSNYTSNSPLLFLISIEKLIRQNVQLNFFSQEILVDYYRKQIKNLLLESTKIERNLFLKFKKSEIYQSITWTLKQRLSIILKLI